MFSDPHEVETDDMASYRMNYERIMDVSKEKAIRRPFLRGLARDFVAAYEVAQGEHFDISDGVWSELRDKTCGNMSAFPDLTLEDVRSWVLRWAAYRRRYQHMTDIILGLQEIVVAVEQELDSTKAYNQRLLSSIQQTEDLPGPVEIEEPTVRVLTESLVA